MDSSEILTERLRLVTITAERMRADFALDRNLLANLIDAEVPPEWPPEHWEPHCFDFIEKMYAEHPQTYGWSRYVVLQAEQPVLIGTLGGFVKSASEAEIGYGILPRWQRNGYATEAARALIAELLRDGSLETISAQTYPHLTASRRVMERCGMQLAGPGEEEGTIRYQLHRSRTSPASGCRDEDASRAACSPRRSTPAP